MQQQRIPVKLIKRLQIGIPLGIVVMLGLMYLLLPGFRTEVSQILQILRQGDIAQLGQYLRAFGIWAPIASILLMIAQALVAPIPTFLVGIVNGLVFGVFWGAMLTLLGATLAAGICFGIARSFGREAIAPLVGRMGLASTDRWFTRWGAYAVLGARLIPGLSFDAISYAAGLTQISFWKFMGATAIGALPQSFIYAYLGQQAPQYTGIILGIIFLLMGSVGTVLLWYNKRRRRMH